MNLTGPRKALSGKIYLIRYNKDGNLLRNIINFSSTASPGSPSNPYLISGDLITIKDSKVGRSTEIIKALIAPFLGIYEGKRSS